MNLKKGGKLADCVSPQQRTGFDHSRAGGTMYVHEKMKMSYGSETLICCECSLYE